MNKYIKKLINYINYNSIFDDDEIFKSNDYDDYDELFKPTLGSIYYKDKIPFAVCIDEGKRFNDKKERYVLLNNENNIFTWTTNKFDTSYHLNNINDIYENGYNNTNILINDPNLNLSWKNLIIDDSLYLPSINELKILSENLNKINNVIENFNGDIILNEYYWSSTEYNVNKVYKIKMGKEPYILLDNKYNYNYIRLFFNSDK
jgi:hypothetical protein